MIEPDPGVIASGCNQLSAGLVTLSVQSKLTMRDCRSRNTAQSMEREVELLQCAQVLIRTTQITRFKFGRHKMKVGHTTGYSNKTASAYLRGSKSSKNYILSKPFSLKVLFIVAKKNGLM